MSEGASARPRAQQWAGRPFDLVRDDIADDLDAHDRSFGSLSTEIRAVKRLLVGVLISTATAAVLLALNLGVGGAAR